MNTEEHDELWQLLGKARPPAVSPFFSRDVLRALRQEKQERRPAFLAWLFRWQPLAAATCVAVVVAGLAFVKSRRQDDEQQQILVMAERVYASPDYTVIGNLDELLDSEKNSAWLTADAK